MDQKMTKNDQIDQKITKIDQKMTKNDEKWQRDDNNDADNEFAIQKIIYFDNLFDFVFWLDKSNNGKIIKTWLSWSISKKKN